jgi:hypothetical protein
MTLADPVSRAEDGHAVPFKMASLAGAGQDAAPDEDNPLAAAVRELLPAGLADKCRIQVIVQVPPSPEGAEDPEPCRPDLSP